MASHVNLSKLRTLRPGEEFVYYRGNFSADISASSPREGGKDKGAPGYRRMLEELRDTARQLHAEGKITLAERPVSTGLKEHVIEYVAIGVRNTS